MKKLLIISLSILTFCLVGCTSPVNQPTDTKQEFQETWPNRNLADKATTQTDNRSETTNEETNVDTDTNNTWDSITGDVSNDIIDTLSEYAKSWEFDETGVDILYEVIDTLKSE